MILNTFTIFEIFEIGFLIILGLLEILLSIFIFIRYQRSVTIILFGFVSLCVGCWVGMNGLTLLFARTSFIYDFTGRLAFVFSAFLFAFLYLFSLSYPIPKISINPRFVFITLIPPVILSCLVIFSKSLIIGFDNTFDALSLYGKDFWIYAIYIIIFYIVIIFELLVRRKETDGNHKRNLTLLIISIFISGIIGITNQLLLPYLFHTRVSIIVGPGASIIWVSIMAYIIFR